MATDPEAMDFLILMVKRATPKGPQNPRPRYKRTNAQRPRVVLDRGYDTRTHAKSKRMGRERRGNE